MNYKLNFLKSFACIGVVFIHISFPGIVGEIISKLAAFAVPIFFMIAGYYSFGKDSKVIKRRLLKILKIFMVAYIIFFAHNLFDVYINDGNSVNILAYFSPSSIVKAVCFCDISFARPLWYLIAMAEAYFLWFFVVKWGKERFLIKLIPLLFLLQVLLISYCDTMQLSWFWKTNFITRAMPWFMMGYYLRSEKSKKIRELSYVNLIIFAAVGGFITLVPTILKTAVDFSSIGYIPYSLALFCLALKNPEKNIAKPLEFIGDKLSLNVYIFHIPIGTAVGFVIAKLGVDTAGNIWMWCRPVIALAVTLIVSLAIYAFEKRFKKQTKK